MALGDGTLNLISSMVDSAHSNLNNYYNEIEECIVILNNSINYQTFIENTEIGESINSKLLSLKKIGDNAAGDVSRLLGTTEDFVEEQRRLNQLAAQQVSYNDSDTSSSSTTTTSTSSTVPNSSKANWYQNYYGGGN